MCDFMGGVASKYSSRRTSIIKIIKICLFKSATKGFWLWTHYEWVRQVLTEIAPFLFAETLYVCFVLGGIIWVCASIYCEPKISSDVALSDSESI